jgi:hypothetical protein
MKREGVCCLVFLACLCLTGAAVGATWDLYKDMNFTDNPNGAWSYGLGTLQADVSLSTPDTSTLMLFNKIWDLSNSDVNDVGISVKKWGYDFVPLLGADYADALIVKHTTEDDLHPIGGSDPTLWRGVPKGQCGLMPGWPDRNYPVVARWTSPIAGLIRVHGLFATCIWNQQAGRWIKHNSTVIYSQPSANAGEAFDFKNVTVAVGDTIDFIASQGVGTYNDQIAVVATIDSGCARQAVYLAGDLNQDCYVNFKDFAVFAQSWMTCNDVQNSACFVQ